MKIAVFNSVYAAALAASLAGYANASPGQGLSERLQSSIKEQGLMRNLRKLYNIAKANGGNRAFGYPGFDASRDYVLSRVKKGKDFRAWTQDFPALFNNVESISFKVDEEDIYVFGLTYSPSTSPEGVTLPLVLGPNGTAACDVASYNGLDVEGKIVLVERGTCPTGGTLAGKVKPAVAAGAANVIVYNNVSPKVTGGTLSAPDPVAYRSSGFINQDDGQRLKARLEAGEALTAYFQQTQTIEERITQNVIAESKRGDPHNVIMLGAHLDSVKAGAGVNDDGSGSSLLLEIFDGLQKLGFRNKIRLAWWGAEENGLVGSRYYTSQINNTREADNLLLYLNFDMVSRGYWGVFDGDGSTHGLAGAPGSEVIEKLFVDYLESKGKTVRPAVFTGGSDYASFMSTLNKPVGGLHTGTGVTEDACYHQECDNIDNPNAEQLTVNARAVAHVLATLAMEGHKLIPKSERKAPRDVPSELYERAAELSNSTILDDELFPWTVMESERHVATCGHDI